MPNFCQNRIYFILFAFCEFPVLTYLKVNVFVFLCRIAIIYPNLYDKEVKFYIPKFSFEVV